MLLFSYINTRSLGFTQDQAAGSSNIADTPTSGIFGESDASQLQLQASAVASTTASRPQQQQPSLGLSSFPSHQRIYLKPLRARHRHHSQQHHHPSHRAAACFPQSAALCSRFKRQAQSRAPAQTANAAPPQEYAYVAQEVQRPQVQMGGGSGGNNGNGDARPQEARRENGSPAAASGCVIRHRHRSAQAAIQSPDAAKADTTTPTGSPSQRSRGGSHGPVPASPAPLATFESSVVNALAFDLSYSEAEPVQRREAAGRGAEPAPAAAGKEEHQLESDDNSTDCHVCVSE